MGLFRRAKKALSPEPTVANPRIAHRLPQGDGPPVVLPHGDRRIAAAGSGYYPEAYKHLPEGPCTAELWPEPGNPHDKNAIALVIRGRTAGYLGAGWAEEYGRLIKRLHKQGPVQVVGSVQRNEHSLIFEIQLLRVDALARWIDAVPADRDSVPLREASVKLWGLTPPEHQAAIEQALGGHDRREITVEMRAEAIERGKYAGQHDAVAYIGSRRIGHIPAKRKDEAPNLFTDLLEGPVLLQANLFRGTEYGHWVRCRVPVH